MQTIEDLVDPLVEATRSGRLKWQQAGQQSFEVLLPQHKLAVWTWTDDEDGSAGVSAELRDGHSRDAERLDFATANEFSPRYDRLNYLLSTARRSALNVDEVISSIKDSLAALSKAS